MKNFIEEIKKELANRGYEEVKDNTVDKNNGVVLHGITIQNEENITPNIYVDEYFTRYNMGGITMTQIVDEIEKVYKEAKKLDISDVSCITDKEWVKDNICFKLVNFDANKERLKGVPYRKLLDLAIIYFLPLEITNDNEGCVTVTSDHMNAWGLSEAELYEFAKENTLEKRGIKLYSLFAKITLNKEFDVLNEEDSLTEPMYILSNTKGINGATTALYTDILKDVASRMESDILLIPSSIHEWILMPMNYVDINNIDSLINEVNSSVVAKDEVLSNHKYIYSKENNVILAA